MRSTKKAPASGLAGASPSKPCRTGQALTGSSIVPEPQSLRCATPPDVLADLADALGIPRGEAGGWHCPSPDHDDEHASAGVFPATLITPRGHGRWKCQACGRGGDAIDLVRTVLGLGFNEAMTWLASWLAEGDSSGPPARHTGRPLNVEAINRAMCEAGRAEDLVERWLNGAKGADVDAAWLVDQFSLGARQGAIVLPYIAGGTKELVGALLRWAPWGKHNRCNLNGSRQASRGVFFGEPRDRAHGHVVLCEGESDTLAVSSWLRDRAVDVLGLPGANTKPTERDVSRLAGRRVFLLFDADEEGEGARATWRASLLPPELNVRVCDARLPEGLDASAAGRRVVLSALREASTP